MHTLHFSYHIFFSKNAAQSYVWKRYYKSKYIWDKESFSVAVNLNRATFPNCLSVRQQMLEDDRKLYIISLDFSLAAL